MGDQFVMEAPPEPKVVLWPNTKGLLSKTVHLTDDHETTLCGLTGQLVLAKKGTEATCKKCLSAVDGWSRVERLIR